MRILPILLNLLLIANCFAGQLKPPRGMQISRGHPQSRGLVLHLPFNEGSGNKVFDLSGNGKHGTLGGAVTWVAGKFGSALEFDFAAGTDYVTISGNDAVLKTMIVWVYLGYSGTEQQIFTQGYGVWRCAIAVDPVNGIGLLIYDGTDYAGFKTPFVAGWHCLVLTSDGVTNNTMKGYMDGVELTTAEASFMSLSSTDGIVIGANPDMADGMRGIVDCAMAYDRILSAGEIAKLYAKPFCMFQQDVPLMAVEAPPPPGVGQVIMITSLPVLFFGLYICRKYNKEVL